MSDSQTYFVDHSAGNGSLDEESAHSDDKAIIEHNGSAKTNTGFDSQRPTDAHGNWVSNPFVSRHNELFLYWNWLNQLNDGRDANDNATAKRRGKLRQDVQTWMSQLEMTSHQRDRVLYELSTVDGDDLGSHSLEAVALAFISLAANKDGWQIRDRPKTLLEGYRDTEIEVSLFKKISSDLGVEQSEIRTLRGEHKDRFR